MRELDWVAPADAFAPLAKSPDAFLLHACDLALSARWSFIGCDPTSRIQSVGGRTYRDGVLTADSPFAALQSLHRERRKTAPLPDPIPLKSGLIGFAGYECARFVETAFPGAPSPYAAPDLAFNAYDAIAAFDRKSERLFLSGANEDAVERLSSRLGAARAGEPAVVCADLEPTAPASNFSRSSYAAAVQEVVERIRDGEVFQANISQAISMLVGPSFDDFRLFRELAQTSSAPFGAFLALGEASVISFSPERFFALRRTAPDRFAITAEPIKGTRPRGRTPEEDAALLDDLLSDAKDRAENIMIADLTRNDLSRLCDDHSIREAAICEAVAHSTVHHLVSRIEGVLRPGIDAVEALSSMFPCGSVTGAPKAQSMKVIADVERIGRGPYCGAIGYIDDGGEADFSVAIRIAVAEVGRLSIPVGGGVTLRSDPAAEYAETLQKARWIEKFTRGEFSVRNDSRDR